MTMDRHLANWHNVWRFKPGADLKTFRSYGSRTSEERLQELHVILHGTEADMLALEHEYAFTGEVERAAERLRCRSPEIADELRTTPDAGKHPSPFAPAPV